jgi:hypothetical protein
MNRIVLYDTTGSPDPDPDRKRDYRIDFDPAKVPQINAEIMLGGTFYRVKDVRYDYDHKEVIVYLK